MKLVKIFSALFVYCILCHFFLANDLLLVSAQTLPATLTREAQVTISTSIGKPVLKLWGYGAPNSRVELGGDKVSDFTYTKSDGYFEFPKAYLPEASDLFYPELCLIEIDQYGRATPPVCIPPLPTNKLSYNIGPIIIPPTISLESGSIKPLSQSAAGGMTIPNSEVKIILAEDRAQPNLSMFRIVKEANAYYIPSYTVKSDSLGYFSFNMPDAKPANWRVFAITNYSQGSTSPKSNTLKLEILSPLATLIQNFWAFLLSLLTWPGLVILEIVVILLIIAAIFLRRKRKKQKHLNTTNPVKQYQDYLNSRSAA